MVLSSEGQKNKFPRVLVMVESIRSMFSTIGNMLQRVYAWLCRKCVSCVSEIMCITLKLVHNENDWELVLVKVSVSVSAVIFPLCPNYQVIRLGNYTNTLLCLQQLYSLALW